MNPYLADILAQPVALREAAKHSVEVLEEVNTRLQGGEFDRILITGMGSSYNSAYPSVIQLCKQPVPVQFVNTAELLHSLDGMIGKRTLLWMNSQSGESAELVHLVEGLRSRPVAYKLAFVNNPSSSLAKGADKAVAIHAGPEATVSTKTYVNMLAVNLLAAVFMSGGDVETLRTEMQHAADAMEGYLSGWQERTREIDAMLGDFQQLFILGRGASMSAVWNGSLINKEAAKCAFEGMHAADFRHGPLELVSSGFKALIFAGSPQTAGLSRELALDITSHGAAVIWIDAVMDPHFATHLLPMTGFLTRPLVEILPMQMVSLAMAARKGLEAGKFRYVGKVTKRE